jgi:cell wall-associated NlpC family hydrolase
VTSATAPSHTARSTSTTRRAQRALATAVGVADIRHDPDDASELVTQALLGAVASPLETTPTGWTRVRLVDYEGWAHSAELAAPTRRAEQMAVVTAMRAPLFASWRDATTVDEVFASSVLPITPTGQRPASGRLRVALPGKRAAWIAASDAEQRPATEPFPLRGPEAMVALGRSLLGVPYLWGGVSQRGIDCSGLAQLASRVAGATILRDADQQYEALPYVVERGSLRLGDLVFFASHGAITHVGIALDNMTLLHASGSGVGVVITSLDPAEGGASASLAARYAGARRVFPDFPDMDAAQ